MKDTRDHGCYSAAAGVATQAKRLQNHGISAGRLLGALAASLIFHGLPILPALRWRPAAEPAVEVRTRVTEFGLERAIPARAPTPPAPVPVTPVTPAVPRTPPVRSARPARPPDPLPVPDLRLREPRITPRPEPSLIPPPDLRREALVARPPRPARPVEPTVANTAADLAPMIPQGSLVTIALRLDRVRETPHARPVRRILTGIRDWRQMLGGISLDVLDDVDRVVLAASNPFGANGAPPDWVVLVKGSGRSDRQLRAAVEAMAASDRPRTDARSFGGTPQPTQPGEDGGAPRAVRPDGGAGVDAGVQDAAHAVSDIEPMATRPAEADAGASGDEETEPVWTARNGAQVATLQRYGAARNFVVLPDGTAAIAMPAQLDALLTAMASRPDGAASASSDPSRGPAVIIESDGVRNVIAEVPTMHGPFPLPRRATLTVTPDEDGEEGATIDARFEYEAPAQARAARDEWQYVQGRWGVMIDNAPGVAVLRAGSGLFGVRAWPDHLKDAVAAMQFRARGASVTGRVHMTGEQVRAILEGARLLTSIAR